MKRARLWLLLFFLVPLTGCMAVDTTVSQAPPTPAELETLRAHQLDPASPQGERKLRDMRHGRVMIDRARRRMGRIRELAGAEPPLRPGPTMPGVLVLASTLPPPREL